MTKLTGLAFLLAAFGSLGLCQTTGATATTGTITLPTYQEGPADFNPPFDQFQTASGLPFVYPYTMRTSFTTKRTNDVWRALFLENEYLKCTFLPDLGGHIHGCTDKVTGREMFYTNTAIKKEWVALRGSWVATGLELNFPTGHSWVSVSPVDYSVNNNNDGSASVWVGNVDRVTGMQWRCEFVLRPGVGVLEQHVTLENRSPVRRRFYFWSNAGVRLLGNEDQFILPANLASVHGSGVIDTWPLGVLGKDWSTVGTYTTGIGYFGIGSREDYLGAYQRSTKSGLLHVASATDVPGKKTWAWGPDPWPRVNLSDDNSTYIEIQGGATESQEAYYYLEPLEVRTFQENWLPIRFVGGVSKANTSAILNLTRTAGGSGVLAEVAATRPIAGASLELWQNGALLNSSKTDLTPEQMATITAATTDPAHVTFRLLDADGAVVLAKTENELNAAAVTDYTLGAQPVPAWLTKPVTEDDYLSRTDRYERLANYDLESADYAAALKLLPNSLPLRKGFGRLLSVLGNSAGAGLYLNDPPSDAEEAYYSYAGARNLTGLQSIMQIDSAYWVPASIEAARILAASGANDGALAVIQSAVAKSNSIQAGAIEIALLRAVGHWDQAADRFTYWISLDPTDTNLRYERYRLGLDDGNFFPHLAADPERTLILAEHLMALGQFAEALEILSAGPDIPDATVLEPGVPPANKNPLVWYYRGYCREKTEKNGADEYRAAAGLSPKYVFPNRAATMDVLNAALKASPNDANALWLRGCLWFSMRRTADAIADWERVRVLKPTTPSLHRSLGRAWLDVMNDKAKALPILQEGLKYEPDNADLQAAIQRAK